MNLSILPLTTEALGASKDVRTHFGLLTNDSLTIAFMAANGIIRLATADADFERVQTVTVCRPSDLAGTPSRKMPPAAAGPDS